ncbi:MAG: M42 family metallopeptidase [Bacillota bacterium]
MELDVLKKLSEAFGPSGFEGEVRQGLKELLSPYCELSVDRLGSLVGRLRNGQVGPKVMIAAHMDEIGFIVSHVTSQGFLRFQTVGGWWEQVMLAQRVTVRTKKGDVPGVIGSKPPHLMSQDERKKLVEKKHMYIDIGATTEEEAKQMGVEPGDPVVPRSEFCLAANGKAVMGKAWDDRLGCAALVELARILSARELASQVFLVGTVQEEVGLRGATTSAELIKPDLAIAVEVDVAGDTPGVEEHESRSKLGKGPTILLYDSSLIPHGGLLKFIKGVAAQEGVPVQFNSMPGGGTDAGRIHLSGIGVPSIVVAVPTRYIHSHTGVFHVNDYDNLVRLLAAAISKLDSEALAEILGG